MNALLNGSCLCFEILGVSFFEIHCNFEGDFVWNHASSGFVLLISLGHVSFS